jgi:hypothetical protein
VIVNGTDPGVNGDEIEADIDLQWSGAVAPAAQVLLVVSQTNLPTYGVDLSALYIVSHNLADVMTLSYGACEDSFADSDTVFDSNIWAQAAAQGISAFVSSGDTGVDGCASPSASTGTMQSVNGLGSSPYATCVGGTQFLDTANPTAYWSTTNDPTTKKSVKGTIPEAAWNETATNRSLTATGGGLSVLFARPPWQNVAGVPAGTGRAVPDISVSASANHTPYFVAMGGSGTSAGLRFVGGTSVSSPAFAGIAALLSQRAGSRLGNLNPLLYALGVAQYGTAGAPVAGAGPFHDVTTGTNTVPGVTGYDAGPGYDAATGLGSPDVTALAAALASPSTSGVDFSLSAQPAVTSLVRGASAAVTASLAQAAGTAAADVVATLAVSGLPAGLSASFRPSMTSDVTTGIVSRGEHAVVTFAASPSVALGTYRLDLAATSGAVTRHVALFVSVGTQAAVPPAGPGVQAPVVLDVFGKGGSHYTSDLVAVNRGTTDVTLLLSFAQTPAPPAAGPVVARSLGAGRQFYVPDVIAFLNANGYALPSDGSAKLGTLFATFVGATDAGAVYVGSRTSTPNPNTAVEGSFGTFSAAVAVGSAVSADAWIYGLRENGQFRSNLALVHAPGSANGMASGPVTLEVQIYDGDSGAPVGAPLVQTLQPGQFFQYSSILGLTSTGVTNGYARVRLTSGSDRFIAYGVVNDGSSSGGGTSDGSFLVANATEGLIPIVLDLPGATHYSSDLTLTNPTSAPVTVTLTYTAAVVAPFSGLGSGTKTVTLPARRQVVQPNAIEYLRSLGLAIPPGGNQGGTLLVSGAPALVRTSNPNPDASVGGTFGVAYPAVAASARAKIEAWVYGLRQDADARTNLAIADARAGDGSAVTYVVDVYDADTGGTSPVLTLNVTLEGGQWKQFDTVLADAGITHGFARVRPSSGTSDYVVYGVVNDGPTPGSRTSDGSYVPMVVVK